MLTRLATGVAVALGLVVGVAPVAAPATPPADRSADRTLTVAATPTPLPKGTRDGGTPTLTVVDAVAYPGRPVQVHGTGFPDVPGDPLLMQVCRAVVEPDPVVDCMTSSHGADDPLRDDRLSAQVDESGAMVGEATVFRHLELPDGWWDCAPVACTMAVIREDLGVVSERVPVTLATDAEAWGSAAGSSIDGFVAPLYRRPLHPDERSALAADLRSGRATLLELVTRAAEDPSVDGTVGEVVRQYLATFGRHPEEAGLKYWVGRLEGGLSAARMAQQFAATPEGRATFAGLGTDEIVETIYRETLDRAPDAAGGAYWTSRLEAGLPLWKLVLHFARSAEFRARTTEDRLAAAIIIGWSIGFDRSAWRPGGTYWAVIIVMG